MLWGLTGGQFAIAGAAACIIEAPRLLRQRVDLTEKDFQRTADLCTLLTVGLLVVLFLDSRHFSNALVQLLGWLPILFYPLILAQRYSTSGRVPASALFWSLRGRTAPLPAPIALDYAYFGICLIAASAANVRAQWYFPAILALGLYGLFPMAPRGRRRLAWAAAAGSAAALGFALQAGLSAAQAQVQEMVFEWLDARWRAQADPYRTRTTIGDLGALKTSNRIVMRLRSDVPPPPLLRTASYPLYAVGTWSASETAYPFLPLTEEQDGWIIARGAGSRVHLSAWLDDGRALLALPIGSYRLDGLHVSRAVRNALGAVRVEEGPQPLTLTAWFDADASIDAAPDAADLAVPASMQSTLDQVAAELALSSAAPARTVEAITSFFAAHFGYTLELSDGGGAPRTLRRFLLSDRRGHCEYFATATVLLLRHARIPARYATGYAVQEFSGLEGQYVIRARHAHAWTLVWLNGRWQALDTTPAIWAEEEAKASSPLRPVYDLLSWLNYRLALWRSQEGDDSNRGAWLGLLVALAAYVGWRIYRRRLGLAMRSAGPGPDGAAPVADAHLGAVLGRLAALGFERPPGCPLLTWVQGLPLRDEQVRAMLASFILTYYRHRFDPASNRDSTAAGLESCGGRLLPMLDSLSWHQGDARPRWSL